MAKVRIPGVSASEGMRDMGFQVFPPGSYLLKIKDVKMNDKDDNGTIVGTTFEIHSEVIGGENLPANENIRDYVGREYVDFIFVMTPEHPSYSKETKIGGLVGEIGIASLKSFLDAAGVKIVNDEFDERKAIGKWIEVRIGTRKWTDRDGNERDSNQVFEYAPHVDEKAVAESAPDEVTFEDDMIE